MGRVCVSAGRGGDRPVVVARDDESDLALPNGPAGAAEIARKIARH